MLSRRAFFRGIASVTTVVAAARVASLLPAEPIVLYLEKLRALGWKTWYGYVILNRQFVQRIESASAFNSIFSDV